ncbi:alcohol dehydrogenase catalytic domain-containing protein [Corynebacterium auriscanis]|uniref:alcohol dehydrogenase catalytic domain-containing protein n=1 Tax=Corynebacterium auriscanis TaxID=99807 RepID=UPI003CF71C1E
MKAIISTPNTPEPQLVDRDIPQPGNGEIIVQVFASTVNPVDAMSPSTDGRAAFGLEGDFGLGWEFSGVVAESAHPSVSPGAKVIGLTPNIGNPLAAHAQYVNVNAEQLTLMPDRVSFVDAATIPLNGLTAFQSLELLDEPADRDLLITGAAGAVGGYALELAKATGKWGRVYGLAREEDRAFVEERGANLVTSLEHLVRSGSQVGAVLDAATIPHAVIPTLADNGNYVGVLPAFPVDAPRGITSRSVLVHSDPDALAHLADLVHNGSMVPRVERTYDAELEYLRAWERLAVPGIRGRQVLVWK